MNYGGSEYLSKIIFESEQGQITASACFCYLDGIPGREFISNILHNKEFLYYSGLKHDKRKKTYLLGRYTAKNSVNSFSKHDDFSDIQIGYGIFNQPLVISPKAKNIEVSITHSDDFGASLSFAFGYAFGIDVEKCDQEKNKVLETQITENEKKLIKNDMTYDYNVSLTTFWTMKEALSKIFKTGLTTSFHVYELDKIESNDEYVKGSYKNFSQYNAVSFLLGEYVFSMVYPYNTKLVTDIIELKKNIIKNIPHLSMDNSYGI